MINNLKTAISRASLSVIAEGGKVPSGGPAKALRTYAKTAPKAKAAEAIALANSIDDATEKYNTAKKAATKSSNILGKLISQVTDYTGWKD